MGSEWDVLLSQVITLSSLYLSCVENMQCKDFEGVGVDFCDTPRSYNSPGQFSIGRGLVVGDVITVVLQEDNILSFRCNGKYFTHPLRPTGTLYPVVMFCGEVKVEIGPEKI
jgi:hypothetical protein